MTVKIVNMWPSESMSGQSVRQILLILVTWCLSGGESCPVMCLCHLIREPKTVLCSDQGLEVLPENISTQVRVLDLSKNKLTVLGGIGRLVELEFVNLSYNTLTSLPEELGDLWKLEKIDLSHNHINKVGNIAVIARLPTLKTLYLRNNPITQLDALESNALHTLDASGCAISKLTNESLIGLPGLKSLSLENNPLESAGFLKSDKLKWLDLSSCMLNLLHPNTFEHLPELEQLRMANNPKLVYSSRKETLLHAKLKRLDVSGCNLDRPGIHGLPSLTHAILARNVIRFLPNRIFARNQMLTHLYLSENDVTQLNASSFEGIPNLEVLDLFDNNLEVLPVNLFEDNLNIKLVNLSHNDITEIPLHLFTSATVLDLSSNAIKIVPQDSLMHMPRLRNLNLGKNRLETFDSAVESTTLRTLILEGNRLVRLSNTSFSNLPSLVGIDLSGNRLTEGINVDVFQKNPGLVTIILHDNPWRCDCDQLHLSFAFLASKTSTSSLICQSPRNVSGYTWATACHLSWQTSPEEITKTERTYGLVLMGLLIAFLVFGSIVSVGHTVKTKRRQAIMRLREAERAEARERLILHRRMQIEEMRNQESVPRVHPEELIGPPTYEEAVEMPRLARSLDNLDSISAVEGLGQSAQSLDREAWTRKRRKQSRKRICKRATRSQDDLATRREERSRSSERAQKNPRGVERVPAKIQILNRRDRRDSGSEEPTSSIDTSWHRTIRPRASTTKKSRRPSRNNGNSSDDEDSDVRRISVATRRGVGELQVLQLTHEPRSGTYRCPASPLTSSPSLISSPEAQGTSDLTRNEIV